MTISSFAVRESQLVRYSPTVQYQRVRAYAPAIIRATSTKMISWKSGKSVFPPSVTENGNAMENVKTAVSSNIARAMACISAMQMATFCFAILRVGFTS